MTLYCVSHKPVPDLNAETISLIQVGQHTYDFSEYRDNQGDNIASRNQTYSELTAFYNVWKNRRSEYVGFCHYRRFFIPSDLEHWASRFLNKPFETASLEGTGEGNYASCYSASLNQTHKILNYQSGSGAEWYVSALEEHDILLPVNNALPEGDMIYQYATSHPASSIFALLQLMSEKDHYLGKAAYEYFRNAKSAHWNNLFITRWEVFSDYCDFLFELLFELEKRISVPSCQYQQRVFAFLSERLLNFWVWYNSLSVAERSWCLVANQSATPEEHQIDPLKQTSYNADWRLKRSVS